MTERNNASMFAENSNYLTTVITKLKAIKRVTLPGRPKS
jgi:hypothetical protein